MLDKLEGAKSFKQHRQWKKKWLRDEVYDIRHNPTRTEDWSSGYLNTPTMKELDSIIVQFVSNAYKKYPFLKRYYIEIQCNCFDCNYIRTITNNN